jgi:hypothetical protein
MKKIAYLAALLAAFALVVSCASAPPKQPEPEKTPEATQPEKQAVPAPDAELSQAKALQQKVDGYGLGTYDPDDYAVGVKDLQAGQDSYGKDNDASRASLQASITAFNAVLTKGGALLMDKEQAQAEASKKAADDLKASVAVKDDYAQADVVYQRAMQEKGAGDIENAGKDFPQSRDMFDAVAATAQQKKDAAEQALKDAQAGGSASEKKAADAQQNLKDEGFAPQGDTQQGGN